MGITYFKPHSSYKNGIIKANFVSNLSDEIVVNATSLNPWHHQIYLSAMLTDDSTYYQSVLENRSTITITFKKALFVSHFSLMSFITGNGFPFHPPHNWVLEGCKDDSCYTLASNSDPSFYNITRMKLSVLQSGVFNKFHFTIQRIEFFGFACDTFYECNGNLIFKTLFCHPMIMIRLPFIFPILK